MQEEITGKSRKVKEIALSNRSIFYELIRSKRKTVRLRLINQDLLEVNAPAKISLDSLEVIIRQKENWINRRIESLRELPNGTSRRCYVQGEAFLYQGERFELRIHLQSQWKKHQVFKEEGILSVWGPNFEPIEIQSALTYWFKKSAHETISSSLIEWSRRLEIPYQKIDLGNGRTLWGTCHRNGTIRVNWRAIFIAPGILDYLLVHELCHLREMNHSSRFWAEVEKILPDYKIRRRKLKELGFLLNEMREK